MKKTISMISRSPYGDEFEYTIDVGEENKRIESFINKKRQTVVVQGLGFVGSAIAAALCNARDKKNNLLYNVIGIDLPDEKNYWKIAMVNSGRPSVVSPDPNVEILYRNAYKNGNLMATYSEYAYSKADVVVVDVHLDIEKKELGKPYDYTFSFSNFKKAIKMIVENIREEALVVIETTVPPGTTEKVIYPIFEDYFSKRGMDIDKLYLAYSFERVMPGPDYLNSIVNFYRVYSGIDEKSKLKVKEFLQTFVNTKDYPLFEMHSPTAAEMAKVLENSFRATNIAFIQEWTEFAQKCGVNLFEVIDVIRMRPTHRNIMLPGFGVGGYCLTKDALLADWSYNNLFDGKVPLAMSLEAIGTNDLMPDYTFSLIKQEVKDLKGRHITVLGITYLNDVADTRNSPAGLFYDKCLQEGAEVYLHDALVTFWEEKNLKINVDINLLKNKNHDIAVFAVRHNEYLNMSCEDILSILYGVKIIVDANNVLTDGKAEKLAKEGIKMIGVGKGHWHRLSEGQ